VRARSDGKPQGVANRGSDSSNSASMMSPVAKNRGTGEGVAASYAVQVTWWPFRTNAKMCRLKSHKIGPRDSSQCTPSTIS
jgi:hypothetical protein